MQNYVKYFERNVKGKDYVVGDIHGCFSKLETHLSLIGFNSEVDRLFSVGDLVDRGPESEKVLEWLDKPWFHPVMGNHDDFVVRYKRIDVNGHIKNGGLWFQGLLDCEKQELSDTLSILPYAIQVETCNGLVGIVHADPMVTDWKDIEAFLQKNGTNRKSVMWNRTRARTGNTKKVQNVERVFVGHTPAEAPYTLGNIHHIDTYGWCHGYEFTVVDISSDKLTA